MRTSTLLAAAAAFSGANAFWKGFNIQAQKADGSCKSTADWQSDFETMANLPGHFTSARVYAASDCDTLANAVPAAVNTGTTLLVGVWTEDSTHYAAEKAALLSVVQQYGYDWIISVSVGSEDLYRGDTDATTLAGQIHDVRGMLCGLGACSVAVGHVDTWTAWVDSANAAVIQACDFIGLDSYPYFQDSDISDISNVFWTAYQNTLNAVTTASNAAGIASPWIWITETGWPTSGPNYGAAVPSVANAQQYWWEVGCTAFNQANTFMYSLEDYSASPSFGVLDSNGNPYYDLTC